MPSRWLVTWLVTWLMTMTGLTMVGVAIGAQISCSAPPAVPAQTVARAQSGPSAKHVLLISVDGLHSLDLVKWVKTHPDGALTQVARRGVTYTNASTPFSDSAPGLISLVAGASPATTGVLYSDTYDRALSPAGSDCAAKGAAVLYDERANKNPDALDAGGGLDPNRLPRDPANGCQPVYPHRYLKVNTIKHRTHSLYRQGLYWYDWIPTMREDWLRPLMNAFERIVREHAIFREIFGII